MSWFSFFNASLLRSLPLYLDEIEKHVCVCQPQNVNSPWWKFIYDKCLQHDDPSRPFPKCYDTKKNLLNSLYYLCSIWWQSSMSFFLYHWQIQNIVECAVFVDNINQELIYLIRTRKRCVIYQFALSMGSDRK